MIRTDRKPRKRLDPDTRRSAILEAGAELFATRSYPEVTISEVAAAAEGSAALVYRYFGGKAELYAEIVGLAIDELARRQREALATLDAGVPVRDKIRAATLVYLDHIVSHPEAWALPLRNPGGEPASVADLRARARSSYVQELRGLLSPSDQGRHEYALAGYFGFLDAACLRWVERGCPEKERWALVDSALGCLQGALGDWAA